MSAQQPAVLVEQLADALAPHQVVVHHDFSKLEDFRVDRPNVRLVPDPRLTGWGTWGFCDAILHSLRYCLDNLEFDYCQVLSPTSLPIRPVAELASGLVGDRADAHADLADIGSDPDLWMSYASRAYLAVGGLRHRVARRIAGWYFGRAARREPMVSLVTLRPSKAESGLLPSIRRRLAAALVNALVLGPGTGHVYRDGFRPFVGSTWFGARRYVCEYLVRAGSDPRLRGFFARLANADEHLFPTLLGNSPFRIGASLHAVSPFDEAGHPVRIRPEDLAVLAASGRFFARKFPDDPTSPARVRALAMSLRPRLAHDASRESARLARGWTR